jgi:hypothetical protein
MIITATLIFIEISFLILIFFNGNHSAIDFLYFIPILTTLIVFLCFKKNKLKKINIILSIIVIFTIYFADRLNVYVEYNKWLKRGMPGAWQKSNI